ncbi:hypothetical protein [Formosa haliotis]|uniref:hypothetical protein n=1 Tax=Formosa haliotis TaxID=1555194 RepID=UPI000A4FF3E3
MERTIVTLLFTAVLMSCNSSDKTKINTASSSNTEIVADSTLNIVKTEYTAIDTDAALIATALLAAPEDSRANCKVIGYNMAGDFVTLKEGDNEFIVLADDPKIPGFSAACYHKSLEPFMARGRVLKAEGKSSSEIFEIREAEAKTTTKKSGLIIRI